MQSAGSVERESWSQEQEVAAGERERGDQHLWQYSGGGLLDIIPFATLDSLRGTVSNQNHHLVSKTGLECGPKVNSALVLQNEGVKWTVKLFGGLCGLS